MLTFGLHTHVYTYSSATAHTKQTKLSPLSCYATMFATFTKLSICDPRERENDGRRQIPLQRIMYRAQRHKDANTRRCVFQNFSMQ